VDAVEDESIGRWLDELASAAPAPGGGAAAAFETATAAALVEMVCNLTIGKPAYAAAEERMTAVRARATALRSQATSLADEDAAAFEAVIAAYRLPKADEAETGARHAAIQQALVTAADVPRRTAQAAAEVVALAASIVDGSNPNVVSDLAAAAAAARAALDTALVNVEINAGSISDATITASLAEASAQIERDRDRADEVVATVRKRLAA
jgi:formiminotetrahydrofolate cyclodeaminase